MIGLLGIMTMFVGLFALCGYLFGVEAFYTWGNGNPGMAVPTAVSFINIGVAIYLVSRTCVICHKL
jgi:hypothetical protein